MVQDYDDLKSWASERLKAHRSGQITRISVAMGACSLALGAGEVYGAISRWLENSPVEAELVSTGCPGLCSDEVLVQIAKPGSPPILFGKVTPASGPQIVADYVLRDDPRPDLALAVMGDERLNGIPSWKECPFLAQQQRILLKNCGMIDPQSIEEYIASGGCRALNRALTEMDPDEVIAEVTGSGLRGRGGAGFPVGRKWQFCRQAPGGLKYVICNADESEPGTFKDRLIMEGDPHSLIEGMIIAGYAVGAQEGYVYIRGEYPLAMQRMAKAIQQARQAGILGSAVLASGFAFDIRLHSGAGAYICGEETALIESLEGKRGMPRIRPPFPPSYGLWGKPTIVNNVESITAVPHIILEGAKWYKSFGTEKSPGTKIYMLLGDVNRRGAFEAPLGLTLREGIQTYGEGMREDKQFKVAQTGGSAASIVSKVKLDVPLDYDSSFEQDVCLGSGSFLIGDEDTDVAGWLEAVLNFYRVESCGKCFPCREGTFRAHEIVSRIVAGDGEEQDLTRLQELSESQSLASLCGLGQSIALPIDTVLHHFSAEMLEAGSPSSAPTRKKGNAQIPRTANARAVSPLVKDALARHGAEREELIAVLRDVNDELGYLPPAALIEVAKAFALTPSEVYSAASFYSLFSLTPRGNHIIRYCESAPCQVMGGAEVIRALQEELDVEPGGTTSDGKFTLEPASCLGICGVGPVITIDDTPYGDLTPQRASDLLRKF